MKKALIAREFRNNPTRSEDIFWQKIRRRQICGLKFLRQYVIQGFIVDFYCPKLKLAIEIDGAIHLNSLEADKERMKILQKTGVIFFRVRVSMIEKDLAKAVSVLKNFIINMHQR